DLCLHESRQLLGVAAHTDGDEEVRCDLPAEQPDLPAAGEQTGFARRSRTAERNAVRQLRQLRDVCADAHDDVCLVELARRSGLAVCLAEAWLRPVARIESLDRRFDLAWF